MRGLELMLFCRKKPRIFGPGLRAASGYVDSDPFQLAAMVAAILQALFSDKFLQLLDGQVLVHVQMLVMCGWLLVRLFINNGIADF